MGRRALRKLPTGLDLSAHYRTVEELPRPLVFSELFGREAPVEIELGSGKGLFISASSAQRPEVNFLGLEMALKYAQFAAARLARQGATNAVMVQGDGLQVFRECVTDASVQGVHVYFPDPWWKARHKKRRVLNAAFLQDVQRVLVPGGTLHFWTDVEEYYLSALELIRAVPQLAGPFEVVESPALHDLDYRTHFERRTRLSGLPVYRSEFRRVS